MSPKDPPSDDERRAKYQMGMAFGLPMLLLGGVLAGLLIGWGATRILGLQPPWAQRAKVIGLVLGVVSGIYESVKVIRKLS